MTSNKKFGLVLVGALVVLALGGVAFAATPRLAIIEAAAPATRAVENSRLFIMVSLLSHKGTVGGYWIGAALIRFWQQSVDIR